MAVSDAQGAADQFIGELLKTQPNLLAPLTPNEVTGQNVAKFFVALRAAMTAEYTAKPKY